MILVGFGVLLIAGLIALVIYFWGIPIPTSTPIWDIPYWAMGHNEEPVEISLYLNDETILLENWPERPALESVAEYIRQNELQRDVTNRGAYEGDFITVKFQGYDLPDSDQGDTREWYLGKDEEYAGYENSLYGLKPGESVTDGEKTIQVVRLQRIVPFDEKFLENHFWIKANNWDEYVSGVRDQQYEDMIEEHMKDNVLFHAMRNCQVRGHGNFFRKGFLDYIKNRKIEEAIADPHDNRSKEEIKKSINSDTIIAEANAIWFYRTFMKEDPYPGKYEELKKIHRNLTGEEEKLREVIKERFDVRTKEMMKKQEANRQ